MIISHGRRYIFIHIPKTGGTSMARALEGRAMADDLMLGDTPKARRRRRRLKDVEASGRLWKHSGISDIYGLVTQEEIDNYFVFTLVRNPWDRLVSVYFWLQTQNFSHPAVPLAKNSSFSDFLAHPLAAKMLRASPYESYLRDQLGRDACKHYIRLEHLETDLGPLEAHLGFTLRPLPHENRSERETDYRRYYRDEDVERVADLCKSDIARFGYRFDSR